MKKAPTLPKKGSDKNHASRIKVAAVLIVIFGLVIWGNIALGWPLMPIAVTLVTIGCLIELNSLSAKHHSAKVNWAMFLQLVIVLLALVTMWVSEEFFGSWPLILLAIAVPVLVQNIAAYYIGRFWLAHNAHRESLTVKILNWYHFRHSPRKTLGVILASTVIAVVIAIACFYDSPLLLSVGVVSAVCAAAGDLLESRLKRLTDVKDSGERLRKGRTVFAQIERGISSHGGFLDRFDSLFFCAAIALIPIIIFAMLGTCEC